MSTTALGRLVAGVGTTLAAVATLMCLPTVAAVAAPPKVGASSPTVPANGPLEAVPGMQSGLPAGDAGIAVLGTLGSDLYLFGSQAQTTGALKGVWRYRSGAWTKLGEASADLDYNQLAMYGAVEYQGSLYIGDRRQGNLYKLVLNVDGSFNDVVSVAKVGNEDVFPGPVLNGKMVLGTFGAYHTGENAGLYSYDGSNVVKQFEFGALGNAGWVTSIVRYGQDVWVTGIDATATLSQVWKFDPSWRATLMYSGSADYRLVTSGSSLFAVRTSYAFPYETHSFARWEGKRFVKVSEETGLFLAIGSIGAVALNGLLLDLCYYNGIYAYDGRRALQQMVPGMPEMGAPLSVKLHDGYFWIASSQPIGLYRMKIGP